MKGLETQKVVLASDEEAQYESVPQTTARGDNIDNIGVNMKGTLPWYNTTKFVIILAVLLLLTSTLSIVFIALYSTQKSTQTDTNCGNTSSIVTDSPTTMSPTISPSTTINPSVSPTTSSVPNNLIIVIGDGMGQSYNAAYRKYKNVTKTPLDEYFLGRYSTTPTNKDGITDSAAGATVFACGVQTHNSFLGIDGFGNPKGSILAAAKRQGKGTGIIATKSITDATPAAFSAQSLYRGFHQQISKQQVSRQIDGKPMLDIMLGGGRKWFEEWGFYDNATLQSEHGWNTVTKDGAQFLANLDNNDVDELPLMGLFADDSYPYYVDRMNGYVKKDDSYPYPGLQDLATKAINSLSTKYSDEGFLLMVEASEVDLCGHDNDIVCLLWEMEEFVATLQYVMEWAENDGDTLVVVLSDHETGGISIGRDGSYVKDGLVMYWDDKMAPDGNVSQYWGSFLYDYNIPEPEYESENIENFGGYKWFPQAIEGSKHTASWFADQLETNETFASVGDLYDGLQSDYIGNGLSLSDLEKQFIDDIYDRNDTYDQKISIAQLMSARTLTGWTTHSHTGADVAVHAFGPNKDMFVGHWTNYEIGQILTKAFGVEDEQNAETQYLEELFLNGELLICDATDKPEDSKLYVEWNDGIEYPVGNLLYPDSKCVEQWV